MPVYNNERHLRQALDSLVNQTFTDWKIFISDDSSQDTTGKICQEYASRDPRIEYFRQPQNLGLFENFKFTLDKAEGEFFMWAAGDDLWEKDYLRTCLDHFHQDPTLGLVTTCNTTIDSFGRNLLESPWMVNLTGRPGWVRVAKYIMQAESYGKCNLMYGLFKLETVRAVWQAYPQRAVWGQDYMFSLAAVVRFGVKVDKVSFFKKRLGGYSSPQLKLDDQKRKLEIGSLTGSKNQMFPFGRFGIYFSGHREALHGTPYWSLAYLLFLRLPRAFVIHIKERSIANFIKRKLAQK